MLKVFVRMMIVVSMVVGFVRPALAEYGAIAYSESTGKYGLSYSYGSQQAAQQRALDECEGSDKEIEVWVNDGWAAVAVNKDGEVAYGWSKSSRADAENRALANGGHGYSILCWVSSGQSPKTVICVFCGREHCAGFTCPWCSH